MLGYLHLVLLMSMLNLELKPFQEAISGAGAGLGSLDFLRNNPQVGLLLVKSCVLDVRRHFVLHVSCEKVN